MGGRTRPPLLPWSPRRTALDHRQRRADFGPRLRLCGGAAAADRRLARAAGVVEAAGLTGFGGGGLAE